MEVDLDQMQADVDQYMFEFDRKVAEVWLPFSSFMTQLTPVRDMA